MDIDASNLIITAADDLGLTGELMFDLVENAGGGHSEG
jgi:hypothetical protein